MQDEVGGPARRVKAPIIRRGPGSRGWAGWTAPAARWDPGRPRRPATSTPTAGRWAGTWTGRGRPGPGAGAAGGGVIARQVVGGGQALHHVGARPGLLFPGAVSARRDVSARAGRGQLPGGGDGQARPLAEVGRLGVRGVPDDRDPSRRPRPAGHVGVRVVHAASSVMPAEDARQAGQAPPSSTRGRPEPGRPGILFRGDDEHVGRVGRARDDADPAVTGPVLGAQRLLLRAGSAAGWRRCAGPVDLGEPEGLADPRVPAVGGDHQVGADRRAAVDQERAVRPGAGHGGAGDQLGARVAGRPAAGPRAARPASPRSAARSRWSGRR